jgi:hypothetical protein
MAFSPGEWISKSSMWNEERAFTTSRFCRRFSRSSMNPWSVVESTSATSGCASMTMVSVSIRSPCRRISRSSS